MAAFVSFAIFSLAAASTDICLFYDGFSVDYQGNIYIGKKGSIDVYSQNSHKIKEIDTYTNRGYQFTIVDGEKVFLNETGHLFVLDLEGNVLQGPQDISEIKYGERPEFSYKRFVAADGNTYVLKSPLWRPTVFCLQDDGKVPVYQMPLLDYFIRLLISAIWLSGWIAIIFILRKQHRNHSALANSHTKGSLYTNDGRLFHRKKSVVQKPKAMTVHLTKCVFCKAQII